MAILFGTPTRFGNMTAAGLRNLLDQTGQMWANGSLIGKVASGLHFNGNPTRRASTTIASFHFNAPSPRHGSSSECRSLPVRA